MKKLIIATFCLLLSVPAMAAGWTNWFTIDSLGYDHYLTNTTITFFYIIPDGTIENPDLCSSSTKYVGGSVQTTISVGEAIGKIELSKLPTLAYTAGWQIRVYLSGCNNNEPFIKSVEIKKP